MTGWFVNLPHSWYTVGVPAVRVMPHTVLSQHLPNGARTSTGRRDRLEPRRNPGAGPRLRTQVQIPAAHGMAGRSYCRRRTRSFAGILILQPARGQGLAERLAVTVLGVSSSPYRLGRGVGGVVPYSHVEMEPTTPAAFSIDDSPVPDLHVSAAPRGSGRFSCLREVQSNDSTDIEGYRAR